MQAEKTEKYTFADHLDQHPEIITRENLEALCLLRASGWRKRAKIVDVSAMGNRLKVPSNQHRTSGYLLVTFLDTLVAPLHCAVVIKEKGISVGTEIFGSKVKKVGRDRQLYMEDGQRHSPSQLDQEYHNWVGSLYKKVE